MGFSLLLIVDLGVCCRGKFFENRVLENTFSGILGPKTLISGMLKTVSVVFDRADD